MLLKQQRLVYSRGLVGNNIYMFTANSTIKQNGRLVMGAGCAKSVRDMYIGIDKQFGNEIEHLSTFGCKFVQHKSQWIGAFQTKIHWQNKSPLDLVEVSVLQLKHIAERRGAYIFHLPCPAVSNGGRSVDDILPMLETLPDNVIVYI